MLTLLLVFLAALVVFQGFLCTKTYLRLRMHWRLRYGFCPNCYSSPPDPKCFVCHGENKYGPQATDLTKARWRRIYEDYL